MPDAERLLTHATGAFVDRAPIDWDALLSQVDRSPDRAVFENLHTLSALRDDARRTPRPSTSRRASAAARLVVAGASIETAALFALLTAAWAAGESLGSRAPQLVLAVAFAAASIPLGVATFRDPRSLFLLATFAAVAAIFARSTVSGLPDAWSAPVNRLLHGIWLEALVPACLWQFAMDFPRVLRFTAFDRFARRAVAAAWILGALLFGLNVIVSRITIDTGPFEYVLRDHSSRLFWRIFSCALAPALVAIMVRSRHAPASERRKVARLSLAIVGGIGPIVLLGVVRTAVPAVDAWFTAGASAGSRWLYHVIVAALASTPILATAAVLADRPFELQAVLRRTSHYAIARGTLAVVAIAPLFLVAALFGVPVLIVCVLAGGLLWTARARLLTGVAHRLSGGSGRDDRRVARALERVSRARGTRETLAALSREIRDGVGAAHVDVLLAGPDHTFAEWSRDAVALPSDSGLAAMLRESREALDLSPHGSLLALLPQADRDWIRATEAQLVAPLRRRDGEMAAVLVLGPKAGGFPFDHRDRLLIVTLLAAAAASFDESVAGETAGSERREVAFECARCGIVSSSKGLPCGCGGQATLAALPACVGGKFLLQRRIGAGGMGIVYLAREIGLDRTVALKTLPGLQPEAVRLLRDEARAMAALNHESLATLYGLEVWCRTPILAVEYFPKGTLARRLASGRLSVEETVALGLRLARALVYMHGRGVLHRDLKPSNVAFTATGAAKLLDFGLATLASTADNDFGGRVGTTRARFAGTPAYVPPEAYGGAAAAPAGDLWALGVVLLECVSGVNPFSTSRRDAGRHRAGTIDVPDLALRACLERALAPAPAARYPDAAAFLAALQAIADASGAAGGQAGDAAPA